MAGSKPGERRGGRKKGVPNKANSRREALIAATGATPLHVMLYRMRHHFQVAVDELEKTGEEDKTDFDKVADELAKADDAARNAAPYSHPKLMAIHHSGGVDIGLGERLDAALKRAGLKRP